MAASTSPQGAVVEAMPTAARDTRPAYIESLTPLRGIAAVWVLAHHFDGYILRLVPPATTGFLYRGYLWVDFFFLLSGFVICHVYGRSLAGPTRARSFWPYVGARFARLYPLHVFTLALMVALWYLATAFDPSIERSVPPGLSMTASTIPLHLVLLTAHGTTSDLSWNMPSWSIAAEWWTYIVAAVALIPWLHRRGRPWAWAAIILGVCGLAAIERLDPERGLDVTFDLGWLRCLLGFSAGVGVYQLYQAGVGRRLLGRDAAFVIASLLVLGLLHRTPADVLLVPAFALLLIAAAYNDGTAKRMLAARPMRFLGDASYSIYMVQVPCLFVVWGLLLMVAQPDASGAFAAPPWIRLLLLALSAALTLGFAAFTFRNVELPAREWMRRRLA